MTSPTALEQLKALSVVVADSGDLAAIATHSPRDATTNPSLILAAIKNASHTDNEQILKAAIAKAKAKVAELGLENESDALLDWTMDYISVMYGVEILKRIPGRVSTEVNARLSFDTEKTLAKARRLIELYENEFGISRERVLIKLAATWEGIQACRVLESPTNGELPIHTNMTLIFNFHQAIACAQANAFLISPFVGRISDFYKSQLPKDAVDTVTGTVDDMGVQSVWKIYHYYKKFHNNKTIIMGASFRNIKQVMLLAGCDYLTISPGLLSELSATPAYTPETLKGSLPQAADSASQWKCLEAGLSNMNLHTSFNTGTSEFDYLSKEILVDEPTYRWELNADAMSTLKLSEGIRLFDRDAQTLSTIIRTHL